MTTNNRFYENFPYDEIRVPQKEILDSLEQIYSSDKDYRYIVIEAGTGVGKSAIAKTLSQYENKAYLLTATKQLQDQYEKDFKMENVKVIKGRSNYKCAVNELLRCNAGECKFGNASIKDCMADDICEYYNAKKAAEQSEMYVSSYSYFLSSSSKAKNFISRDLIIIDECHLLEDQLINFAGFSLSQKYLNDKFDLSNGLEFEQIIQFNKIIKNDGYEDNIEWINFVKNLMELKLADYSITISSYSKVDRKYMTVEQLEEYDKINIKQLTWKINELEALIDKINTFCNSKDKRNWLMTARDKVLKVQPVNIEGLFGKFIDRFATKKVVFMSATILDKTGFCKDIGLNKNNTCIISKDSTFNSKMSPIVYNPVGSMNYKNLQSTMPNIIKTIKKIMEEHKNEKGIIHTSTYSITNAIIDSIKSKRFIYKSDKESNEMLLEMHKLSLTPTILISPSLMTGTDLKDDLSRFQIIVKMPFISMADDRVKKKMEINKTWYQAKMMRDLVQSCGRSTRSQNDWSVTYILDSSFMKWACMYSKWTGQQFHNRIVDEYDFNLRKFKHDVKKLETQNTISSMKISKITE